MSADDQVLLPGIGVTRRISTAFGRRWLHWRFRLTQRGHYDRLTLEHVLGRPLLVLPQVFNPMLFPSGEALVKAFEARAVPEDAFVLDMGTGSGVVSVAAAKRVRRVVAVDINNHAVRCARINALLNGAEERIDVREGDLFSPLQGARFDVVLFNPPFFRGRPRDPLDHAWRSMDVVERFATGLGEHLAEDGYALVVLSTDGETRAFLEAFSSCGLVVRVASRTHLMNETLTVYELRARGQGADADSV